MRLNHLTLSVADVSANRSLFETYFGMKCTFQKGEMIALLTDESDFLLNLIHFKGVEPLTYSDHPEAFHIGFMQDSPERVDEIHAQLVAGGFDPPAPRKYHGAWTFYFKAPGGFLVEVTHQYKMNWNGGAAETEPSQTGASHSPDA